MVPPCRLKSVTIGSDMVVDSIAFSYSDCNGQQHTAGPWGGYRGSNYTVSVNHLNKKYSQYIGYRGICEVKLLNI